MLLDSEPHCCSLKYINVAMVTVLKNVTNVMTAVGEMYLFNKHHDNRVWTALFLMVCGLAGNLLGSLIFVVFLNVFFMLFFFSLNGRNHGIIFCSIVVL